MEAYLAAGEKAQALRHYDKLRKLLREELGVEPSPETQRCVTASPPPATHPGRTAARRRGRGRACHRCPTSLRLRATTAGAPAGAPQVTCLRPPPSC